MTEKLAGGQPIHRAGQPEDIAHAALYLASDHASFVNGHALVVDGGLIGGQKWDRSWIAREGLTSDEDIREGGKKGMNRILISLALMLFIACGSEQPDRQKRPLPSYPKAQPTSSGNLFTQAQSKHNAN